MNTAHEHTWTTKPLLGLRRRPGRLALWFMRAPLPLYRRGWGRVLGHTFLLIAHQGRKTGKRYETVAMAATYNLETKEAVVCSVWGKLDSQPPRPRGAGNQDRAGLVRARPTIPLRGRGRRSRN